MLYPRLFGRKAFRPLNRALLRLATQGLGIGNFASLSDSGEKWLLTKKLRGRISHALDIGANEGDYTHLVTLSNPGAKVWAFEPHPVTASRLEQRFSTNKNVSVLPLALADRAGEAELHDYADTVGTVHASLLGKTFASIHQKSAGKMTVRTDTIDNFVARQGLAAVDLIKIDAEGLEMPIIKGGAETLDRLRVPYLQFEFGEHQIFAGTTLADFIDAMPAYTIYRILPRGLVRVRPNSIEAKVYYFQNLLAVRGST